MSFSGARSKKTITNDTQHAHDEQSDKAISTTPKRRYATRSATKQESPTTNKLGDHRSTRNSKSKNSTSPSSPCELSQTSDCQCAGTSRNTTTKKSTVQSSLPSSTGRVSKAQHKGQDAAPKKGVTPKKRIVSGSSQKSSQLPLLHHSKKTKDLKAEDQSSTIPCSSSQTSQFLEDHHTTKDPKLGNKTTSSAQEPSQPAKDHRPKKTQNIRNLKKSEISTPSSEPSEVQHALGSKYSESKTIVISNRSPSKSIQPSKPPPVVKISKDSTSKNKEKIIFSLTKSNLVSQSELADLKGKTKLLEETPKQLYNKARVQYFITWNGFEEPEPEPCGLNCYLCAKDLACSLGEDNYDKSLLPEVAVLPCGHAFHSICLSLRTSEEQYQYSREPKCLACLGFS